MMFNILNIYFRGCVIFNILNIYFRGCVISESFHETETDHSQNEECLVIVNLVIVVTQYHSAVFIFDCHVRGECVSESFNILNPESNKHEDLLSLQQDNMFEVKRAAW